MYSTLFGLRRAAKLNLTLKLTSQRNKRARFFFDYAIQSPRKRIIAFRAVEWRQWEEANVARLLVYINICGKLCIYIVNSF